MATTIAYVFRFLMYVMFGLSMEVLFAVHPIEMVLGCKVNRRVPKKYLEGFVSAYMIPLHGLGVLFGFESMVLLISDFNIAIRFVVYSLGITVSEALWGYVCDKVLGFYSWDYYADSKYKIFERGYTLWTLVPIWGIAGMILEIYTKLMVYLSPHVVEFFTKN